MADPIRKLAAIMFTDIAGFTALSSEDEEAAVLLLDKQRKILKPIVDKHEGQWLKEIGDGLLLSFPSSKKAVLCAIEIQQALKDIKNLNLRIGIHQGDIMVKGGDIFGDDVNIASRMEPFSAVGGVAISHKVAGDISGSPEFKIKFIGEPNLKGVKQKVKVYCIISHDLPATRLADVTAKLDSKPQIWKYITAGAAAAALGLYFYMNPGQKIESVALLPFTNETHETGNEYLISGVYDGILGELSKFSSLRVISRRSAMQYSKSKKTIAQIAEELNVDALIEAALTQSGDSLGVRLQLIQVLPSERNLWIKEFNRGLSKVYNMYNEIALEIAGKINLKLTIQESISAKAEDVDPAAYKAYLRGRFHAYSFTPKDFDLAIEYYTEALNIAPDFPMPQAGIAIIWASRKVLGIGSPFVAMREERKAAKEAVRMDSTLSEAHRIMAVLHAWTDWDWPKAEAAFIKALAMDPNNADAHIFYGHFLHMMLRPEEATEHMQRALVLDPLNSFFYGLNAFNLVWNREYDQALAESAKAIEAAPNYPLPYLAGWAAQMAKGEPDDGLEAAAGYMQVIGYEPIVGDMSEGFAEEGYKGAMRIAADKLSIAAETQHIKPFVIAFLYAHSEEFDRSFEWLEIGREKRDPASSYLSAHVHANVLPAEMLNDYRLSELLRRCNLPE